MASSHGFIRVRLWLRADDEVKSNRENHQVNLL
jgi:hypothetical protein